MGQLVVMLKTKQAAVHQLLRRRDGISVERSADPSDEAQSALDRELSIRALDRESSLLSDIRFALQRIDDGTYGVCQSCEEDISEKRLAAMPWAKYCIKCQQEMDRASDRQQELLAAS